MKPQRQAQQQQPSAQHQQHLVVRLAPRQRSRLGVQQAWRRLQCPAWLARLAA
jgi:hypothetical protein